MWLYQQLQSQHVAGRGLISPLACSPSCSPYLVSWALRRREAPPQETEPKLQSHCLPAWPAGRTAAPPGATRLTPRRPGRPPPATQRVAPPAGTTIHARPTVSHSSHPKHAAAATRPRHIRQSPNRPARTPQTGCAEPPSCPIRPGSAPGNDSCRPGSFCTLCAPIRASAAAGVPVVHSHDGWVPPRNECRAVSYAGAVHLGLIAIVVSEYDPAISFFVDALGFELAEDSPALTRRVPQAMGSSTAARCRDRPAACAG